MARLSRRAVAALAAASIFLMVAPRAGAQDKPRIRVGSLTLPVFAPIVVNIMKDRGFDVRNGFELEIRTYPSISSYYAGLATGEVDALAGGPSYFQKLRLEGVPIKIIATAQKLSDLVVVTQDPGIRSLADLRGRQLAADMGSGQFQLLSIYAKSRGFDLRRDLSLVNANFAVSRAQLAAGRVDAAMIIEPIATMMKRDMPGLRIIFNAEEAWMELTGHGAWELVMAMREDAIKQFPDMPARYVAALQDVASFINSDPDAADRIAAETVKLPPGVLKEAVAAKRWELAVNPASGPERAVIWDMFARAVAAGFHPKLPDEAIIYVP